MNTFDRNRPIAEIASEMGSNIERLDDAAPDRWREGLHVNGRGDPEGTAANVAHALERHPRLRGRIALNTFARQLEVIDVLPWDGGAKGRAWQGSDDTE